MDMVAPVMQPQAISPPPESPPQLHRFYHERNPSNTPPIAFERFPLPRRTALWPSSSGPPRFNMAELLKRREMGAVRRGAERYVNVRHFYQAIYPDKRVEAKASGTMNQVFLRAWSPNGAFLIGMRTTMMPPVVAIYRYEGVNRVYEHANRTENIMESMLPLHAEVSLDADALHVSLQKNAFVFTSDSRFLVAITTIPVAESGNSLLTLYGNASNEVGELFSGPLERYRFYCIDVQAGRVTDSTVMEMDYLHTLISVAGDLVSFFSIHFQTIYIYRISSTGSFQLMRKIGEQVLEDDPLYLCTDRERATFDSERRLSPFFSGFKHRVLAFLFRQARAAGTINDFIDDQVLLRDFRIVRVQLVDQHHILVRMSPDGDSLTCRQLIVLFDWEHAEVLSAMHVSHPATLRFFQENADHLLRPDLPLNPDPCPPARMPAFSLHFKRLSRAKQLNQSEYSQDEIRRKVLNYFPLPYMPILTTSPFLDPHLWQMGENTAPFVLSCRIKGSVSLRSSVCLSRSFTLSLPEEAATRPGYLMLLLHPIDPLALLFDRSRTADSHSLSVYLPHLSVR